MVKFSRQELISHLHGKYGIVTIVVIGELYNGVEFEGSDTLKVIEPRYFGYDIDYKPIEERMRSRG